MLLAHLHKVFLSCGWPILPFISVWGTQPVIPIPVHNGSTECWDIGVPETILDAIMSQVAWDGSIPHVGIIHWVFDLSDKPTILWYIEHSIPVWYPWGPTEEHMCSIEPQGNKY